MAQKTILIVEDEPTAAKALQRKFESSGFAITLVEDGEEASKAILNHSFDVILLDIILPKKDGYAVLEEMKQKNIKTPVIVLSNLCAEMDTARSKELGAKAHYIKSMTPMKDIVTFIESILQQ